MIKKILYIILLSQLLLVGCSSLGDLGVEQASVDNIRKAQEVAKISRDIYDLQSILANDEVNFSTLSANFKVFGIKEYLTVAEIVTDLKSISKALDDGNITLAELEDYSKLTGTLMLILDPPDNQVKGDYSGLDKQANTQKQTIRNSKVVTLADVNAYDLDSIEDFKLPENTFSLSKLDIIDSLYYYNSELYSGIAYSSFGTGQISEFKTIKDGFLSGPSYAWYEDGTPAMQANFLDGYLSGRFIAWSEVGDTIYDIYFNKGQFKSDLQFERDTTREEQDSESSDGDADSEANSGE